ncbi:MAG: pyridoxamine 5'-phosphate oxidase family protein [Rhodococcus sp. (in: high G+C Gram-positive bacteria)]
MNNHYHHLAFGTAALARQKHTGSYQAYGSQTERADDGPQALDDREKVMIQAADQFYLGTVTESGWPYVQYRSGPAGFLRVLDDRTIGFADFAGNNQFVTAGNLDANDRVTLILVDYPRRRRVKIYGRARVIERSADPELLARLLDLGTSTVGATSERSIVITVEAIDWNCTRSIIPRYDQGYMKRMSDLYVRDAAERERVLLDRIAELEARLDS